MFFMIRSSKQSFQQKNLFNVDIFLKTIDSVRTERNCTPMRANNFKTGKTL